MSLLKIIIIICQNESEERDSTEFNLVISPDNWYAHDSYIGALEHRQAITGAGWGALSALGPHMSLNEKCKKLNKD
jgi:hypothetical protein